MVTREHDRAQLIVVGSILIAVVVLGVAVILNSVVVTGNTQAGAGEQLVDAREVDYETRTSVRSILLRLNHPSTFSEIQSTTPTALEQDARQNVEDRFGPAFARSYASSGPTSVDVRYRSTTLGSRVVQAEDARLFSDGPGNPSLGASDAERPNWSPAVDQRQVGWFTLNIDVSESRTAYLDDNGNKGTPFVVRFRDSTGDYRLRVDVEPVVVDGDLTVEVRSEFVNGPSATTELSTVRCDPENGRVLLDFVEGESAAGDCSFHGLEDLDVNPDDPNAVDVSFSNGDNLVGKYEFVTENAPTLRSGGTTASYRDCEGGGVADSPCESPVVWEAGVGVSLRNSDADYANEFTVEVYP